MKVKALLLVATIASLLALFVASGAVINRGGELGTQGIIPSGPQASGIIVDRGGASAQGTVHSPLSPHWF